MKKNIIVGGVIALVAAVLYFVTEANYAFPGESASLMAAWNGLDPATTARYPLMGFFARAFGGGNLLAVVAGVVSVVLLFGIAYTFFRRMAERDDDARGDSRKIGLVAGSVAALVYMLTPAVHSSATHLEPRLFEAVWMLGVVALFVPYVSARRMIFVYPLLMGALSAFAFCDSALALVVFPALVAGIVLVNLRKKRVAYGPLTVFAFSFLIALAVALCVFDLELKAVLKDLYHDLCGYFGPNGWFFVSFAAVPFLASLFSAKRAFTSKPGFVHWLFHSSMTLFAILAIATPLSPSSVLIEQGVYPVVTSAYAAWVAGYLAAFWWFNRGQIVGMAVGGVAAFVILFATLWNLFTFDSKRGAFADEVARRLLADMGERTWLVSDGVLDNHLLLVAAKEGKELNLVSLNRAVDRAYVAELAKKVKAKKLAGDDSMKEVELVATLTDIDIYEFVRKWLSAEPKAAEKIAIYGAPDLWLTAQCEAVPEFLFFGANPSAKSDWSDWPRFDELLDVGKGWGSYRTQEELDPVLRMKMHLRRHFGLVANNRGVWLQDHQSDDEAFAMYELVLGNIDRDNVCSIFNELEMASQKYPGISLARRRELENRISQIEKDKERRYILHRLSAFYGYIRNPALFMRLGVQWAKSGRPGDAIANFSRAMDFVPDENRVSFFNLLASLYASESRREAALKAYQDARNLDASNHDAIVGIVRLKLLDGDTDAALEYLQKAIAVSPEEGRNAHIDFAMVSLIKNDLPSAKEHILSVVEKNPKDMQAWSFLSAITLQQYDAEKDAEKRRRLLEEVGEVILPEMERHCANQKDFYFQTTKAFYLLRQSDDNRKAAREALLTAAEVNPSAAVTQDLILGLDISLDDKESAAAHARDVLRRNDGSALANYVMGSLAIREGDYTRAEMYLTKAQKGPKPNVLALNDLAEVYRRTNRLELAEDTIERALAIAPDFYILHETYGVVLMAKGEDLAAAEEEITKALNLSKKPSGGQEDVRLFTSLARIQVLKGDKKGARSSLRKVRAKLDSLPEKERKEFMTDYEMNEFTEVEKSVDR